MFSFVQHRYSFYAIALILIILSLVSPFFIRLNMGIDMTGGMQIEYQVQKGNIDTIIMDTRDRVIHQVRTSLDSE